MFNFILKQEDFIAVSNSYLCLCEYFNEISQCINKATYKHRLAYTYKFWKINIGVRKAFICKNCYNKLPKGVNKHERIFNALSVEY